MKAEGARFKSNFVRLNDGQRCHILDGGSGRPVVFIHGLPGVGSDFFPLAARLAARYRCILIDRAGYGLSPLTNNTRPMSVGRSVDDVIQILKQLNLRNVVLIGWSYGGHIAAQVSNSASDLVSSLVLLGSAGPSFQWPNSLIDRLIFHTPLGSTLLEWVKKGAPGILRNELNLAIGEEATNDLFDEFLASLNRPGMIKNWLREGRNWQPSTMQPETIKHPSLILHGEKDIRVPIAVARETARHISRVYFRSIPEAGHWPFLTHTCTVEAEIIAFIE